MNNNIKSMLLAIINNSYLFSYTRLASITNDMKKPIIEAFTFFLVEETRRTNRDIIIVNILIVIFYAPVFCCRCFYANKKD